MITNIDSYVLAVTNVPALLQNKDLLENLHPRYTELLARCNVSNPNASPTPTTPLDAAFQNLIEIGLQADSPLNKYSIGIATLLCAKTRTNEFNTNFENFLVQLSGFVDVADWEQLRMVAGVVTEIATAVADQMIRRNQPILGINLLGNVASRLQAHDKMLTCVHSCVLQLCCASYNFKAGLKFIIDDFEEFTTDLKQSDNTSYLLTYLYYAGLINTALKNYDKAIYFFEACTRVPAITLSHIMLESYKKHILVCLIHLGEVPPPHKTAAQVVNRVLKPSATPYTDLATAFAISSDALNNCIAKHLDTYRNDQNYGLVKQVRSAHMRVLIRKLTRTFLTLSLEDVGRRAVVAGGSGDVGAEAERVVLGMIEGGGVCAKINQKDGMVRFLDELGGRNNGILEMIEGKINSCMELNRRINTMNERISTNPEFISKVVVSLDASGTATGNALHSGDIDGASGSGLISSTKLGGTGVASSSAATSSGIGGRASNSNVTGAFNL